MKRPSPTSIGEGRFIIPNRQKKEMTDDGPGCVSAGRPDYSGVRMTRGAKVRVTGPRRPEGAWSTDWRYHVGMVW